MGSKSGQKGRYICKVGFYDIYAKDSYKAKKESKYKYVKADVSSTEYNIIHSKKLVERGFKTKDLAVQRAIELLGDKKSVYGIK